MRLKRVFRSYDRLAVHHARNVLASGGIECLVRNEFLSSVMGELPPEECQAEVWVLNDAAAADAEAMLRFSPPSASATAWHCRCGEWIEPQFSACWHCMAQKSETP